jgi:hypothetical protein
MPEMDDNRVADIVDEHLRSLRGEGPRPDLAALSDDERAEVLDLLELVDALADRLPLTPPLEEDPIALRLGLVAPGSTDPADPAEDHDPVAVSAHELAYRFGGAVEVDEPRRAASPWRSSMVCRSLAEVVLVVTFDADEGYPVATDARSLFAEDPRLSAVAFTSSDAAAAAVVLPAYTVDRLVPVDGWRPPPPLDWEPLGIALGRHFERSMPRWDETTTLPPGDLLDDLADEANAIVSRRLHDLAASRPQLPHKRHARDFVAALDPDLFVVWVDGVRARRSTGDDLVSELSALCAEGSP